MKTKHLFIALFCLLGGILFAQETAQFEAKTFNSEGQPLNYRILYPKDFSPEKNYPLLLFLHGAGERGSDNEKQLVHGSKLFLDAKNREQYPAIVVFPQCPEDSYWSNVSIDNDTRPRQFKFNYDQEPSVAMNLVMKLMDSLIEKPFVKKEQIYVGGLSMGGMGTYEIAYRMPGTFAAAFAICGGGDTAKVSAFAKATPFWIIHGAQDDVVNPNYSLKMTEALLQAGAFPKMSLYENANHNSWDTAFAEADFLPWIFSKSKME